MTRCGAGAGAGARCILDRQICDGQTDCPLGDDEVGLVTSDGVHLQCRQPGAQCRIYPSKDPAGVPLAGRQCEGGDCVAEDQWCDDHCDCPPHCEDQTQLHCQDWPCPPGLFKCAQSGLCLRPGQLCDGRQDCGPTDGSDEAGCPCDQPANLWDLDMTQLIRELQRARSHYTGCLVSPETFTGIRSVQIDRVRSGGIYLVICLLFSIFLLQENC